MRSHCTWPITSPTSNPVEEIEVPEGHFRDITLHDGSTIRLETISEEHDPADAMAAFDRTA